VVLNSGSRMTEEVGESSLLDELVFFVDADVLHLFLGVSEVSLLDFFGGVGPLGAKLLGLITRVDVVEDSELGTEHVGEVSDLNEPDVHGNQELVVEDESTDPLVVRPATHSRDRADR